MTLRRVAVATAIATVSAALLLACTRVCYAYGSPTRHLEMPTVVPTYRKLLQNQQLPCFNAFTGAPVTDIPGCPGYIPKNTGGSTNTNTNSNTQSNTQVVNIYTGTSVATGVGTQTQPPPTKPLPPPPAPEVLPALGRFSGTMNCDGNPFPIRVTVTKGQGKNVAYVDSTSTVNFLAWSCTYVFSAYCEAQKGNGCSGYALTCSVTSHSQWDDSCFGNAVPRNDVFSMCYSQPGARSMTITASDPTCATVSGQVSF